MKLRDAYFGIKRYNFSTGELETCNLFDSVRVLDAVAMWKTMPPKNRKYILDETSLDLISYCFGDTRGRAEYSFFVNEWLRRNREPQEVDIYEMYVLPNAKLLEAIVDSISVDSCRQWRKERKNARSGCQRCASQACRVR